MIGRGIYWLVAASIAVAVLWVGGSRIAAVVREAGTEQPPSDGRLVPTSDGAIFAQIRGPETAKAVLLLHGTAAWSGFWQDIAVRLAADGFRTIAIDLPPFGYSDRSPQQTYGRIDQARRVADVIRNLKLQNTIIVGHSFGAGTVVETVMQNPSLFKAMVLISGALGLPEDGKAYAPDGDFLRWSMGQPWITESLVASTVTNPLLMRPLLASLLYNKAAATDAQVTILKRPYARAGTTAAYAQWLPALLLADRSALSADAGNYASLGLPTSLIWGDRDEVTPLPQGQQLNRLIRHSSLSIIENVGHIPHIEAPDRLYEVLRKELTGLSVR